MRAKLDPAFSDYLLRVGNGTEQIVTNDTTNLPTTMILPYIDDMTSLTALIDAIFLNINNYPRNLHLLINRAILTPKNDCVDEINNLLIKKFSSEVT